MTYIKGGFIPSLLPTTSTAALAQAEVYHLFFSFLLLQACSTVVFNWVVLAQVEVYHLFFSSLFLQERSTVMFLTG